MTNHRSRWTRAAVVPAVALALTLSACGSDDGDNDAADTVQDGADEDSLDDDPADDEDAAEDDGLEDDASDETDEAGGGDAHEQFEGMDPVLEGMSFGDFAGPIDYDGAELWIKVDKVDEGEQADWPEDAFSDPSDIEGLKPIYPHITIVHAGGEDLEREGVIRDSLVYTADGDPADSIVLIGVSMPGDCGDVDREHDFSLGVEETQCEVGAIDENAEVGEVHFYTDDHELVWTA